MRLQERARLARLVLIVVCLSPGTASAQDEPPISGQWWVASELDGTLQFTISFADDGTAEVVAPDNTVVTLLVPDGDAPGVFFPEGADSPAYRTELIVLGEDEMLLTLAGSDRVLRATRTSTVPEVLVGQWRLSAVSSELAPSYLSIAAGVGRFSDAQLDCEAEVLPVVGIAGPPAGFGLVGEGEPLYRIVTTERGLLLFQERADTFFTLTAVDAPSADLCAEPEGSGALDVRDTSLCDAALDHLMACAAWACPRWHDLPACDLLSQPRLEFSECEGESAERAREVLSQSCAVLLAPSVEAL